MRRTERLKLTPLQQEYHALAKKADRRLRTLEKISTEEHYHGVLDYSYKKALKDINRYNPGGRRFETKAPTDEKALQEKINDIRNFLDKPTSTKAGINRIYKKRADTINRKYAKSKDDYLTWQEVANYYEKVINDKMDKLFASKTSIKVIGSTNKLLNTENTKTGKNFTIDEIKSFTVKEINTYVDDEVLSRQIQKAVKELGEDLILK